MKRFRITVNGEAYDVSVEELGAGITAAPAVSPTQAFRPAPPTTPRHVAPTTATAPKAAPTPTVPTPKPVTPTATVGNTINAPMPGVILNVMVSVGQQINAGDVLLILEAMKMENEVTTPTAGTVKEVAVSKGVSVNTGDVMVVIE